LSELSYAPIIG